MENKIWIPVSEFNAEIEYNKLKEKGLSDCEIKLEMQKIQKESNVVKIPYVKVSE